MTAMPTSNQTSVPERSRKARTSAIVADVNCIARSQRRRVPYRSTYGAHKNFRPPHGANSNPYTLICVSEYPPSSRRMTGTA